MKIGEKLLGNYLFSPLTRPFFHFSIFSTVPFLFPKLMKIGERLLGNYLFSTLTRPFFYEQFVGGDTEAELTKTAKNLLESNVRLMVCPVQEEDVDDIVDK